jgi:cell division septation protein DedD
VLLFNAYILLETYPVLPLSNALSKMNLSINFEKVINPKSIDIKEIKVESPNKEVNVKEPKAISQIIVDSVVSSQTPRVEVETPVVPNIQNTSSTTINIGDSVYYIIVGAFRHSKRATALSTKLKNNGYEASEVVKPKKFHFKMVTVGSFTNMSEVSKSLIQVQEKMPDAWVCMSVK